jgi:REP element-mobilizing transposase RayT
MPQSYVCLPIHVVFSTKNRAPFIQTEWEDRLYSYIGGILREEKCVLLAAGGMPDHVHLLISWSKERSVADVLRVIKTNSSKWIHETIVGQADFAWQSGYSAFAVSQSNLEQVRRYIANQKQHHRTITFKDEFIAFLKKHGNPYNDQYIFDEDHVA